MIITISLCAWSILALGQSDKMADSLLLEIKYASSEEKIELTKSLSRTFCFSKPKLVKEAIDSLLKEAPQLSLLDNIEFNFTKELTCYYLNETNRLTDDFKKTSEQLAQYDGDKNEHYYFLKYREADLKAILKNHNANTEETLKFHLEAVKYARLSNNNQHLGNAYNILGTFYIDKGEYTKAIKYLELSRQLKLNHTTQNEGYYTHLYSELATAYGYTNQLDSAEKYINLVPLSGRETLYYMDLSLYHKQRGNYRK
ncbi:MAG: hypothetical protein AAF806_08795, partial [Bacteroidota bacterium]